MSKAVAARKEFAEMSRIPPNPAARFTSLLARGPLWERPLPMPVRNGSGFRAGRPLGAAAAYGSAGGPFSGRPEAGPYELLSVAGVGATFDPTT